MAGLSDTVTRRLREYMIREPGSNLYRYARDPETGVLRELPQPWQAAPVSHNETRPYTEQPGYRRMMILAKKEDQDIKRDHRRTMERKGEQISAINHLNNMGITDVPESDEELADTAMALGWTPRRNPIAHGGILDPGIATNPWARLSAQIAEFFEMPPDMNREREQHKVRSREQAYDQLADMLLKDPWP